MKKMAKCSRFFSSLFLSVTLLLIAVDISNASLEVGYYKKTCPNAEVIVKKTIDEVISVAPSLAGPLLRLHFHDCFVRGCEASLLLNSPTKQGEKDAIPNQTLRGFQIVDRVKTSLEKECPVVVTKGISWDVETGRRDGRVSNVTEANFNLIPPFANINALIAGFKSRGLSVKDLVVLSGSHTIGTAHCLGFENRLYNFTGKGDTDPALDSNYIPKLKAKCKPGDQTTLVEMDPGSFKTFDEKYYTLVAKRRGLFQSDSALLDNSETRAYVKLQSATHGSTFGYDFGVSMVNMGRIGVLTGTDGEIRKVCTAVN